MSTVGKLVVLKLDGNLEQQGFLVTAQIGVDGDRPMIEVPGALPADPELVADLDRWQQSYRSLGSANRIMPQEIIYGGSVNGLEECRRSSRELRNQLNHWLESRSFRAVDQQLREALSLDESIRVVIRTQNSHLRRLPWHLWDFVDHYPKAEVALGAQRFKQVETARTRHPDGKVKILAILGNGTGINIEEDRQVLERLPDADVTFLVEPARQQMNRQLWEQPWDILFFAGHSQSEAEQGRIYLNLHESLTLEELKYGLRQAIAQGLQLAIFNSCDGLGLARELEQLHLPQMIVMREPIPDPVAQEFLQQFLAAFVRGESLYLASRQARERLQGLEGQFPCASWLPVICQSTLDPPVDWQGLVGLDLGTPSDNDRSSLPATQTRTLAAIVFTDVESFTAKMSADEQHALHLVRRDFKRMQQVCQQFEGQVLKSLGDGLLMYFVSAERAVACAIEIQTQLAAAAMSADPKDCLKHRIGIHLGEVEFADGDVLGNGVNIAARLQQESPPGGVCLSRSVYEVVKDCLTLPALDGGLRSLKGIPDSLKVYQILPPIPGVANPRSRDRPKRSTQPLSWQQLRLILLTSWIVTSLVMGLRLLGGLQQVELLAFDHLMRLRPVEAIDNRLLLITLDEADLNYQDQNGMQRQGSLSDKALNQLLTKLEPYKPVAIGLDIYRDRSTKFGAGVTQTQLQSLIAVCTIGGSVRNPNSISPPPGLPLEQIGFGDTPLDSDQIIRRQFVGSSPSPVCNTDKSLNYLLARRYLNHRHIQPVMENETLHLGDRRFLNLASPSGGYHRANLGGYDILLNYRASEKVARQVSLTDVLSGRSDAELPDLVRDRVVLIGTIARSFKDYHQTPLGELAGVEIQAHMVSQILSAVLDDRPLLWYLPQWGDALWIGVWSMVGATLALQFRSRSHKGLAGCGALGCLYGVCFLLLLKGGWLPLVPSALAFMGSGYGVAVYRRSEQ